MHSWHSFVVRSCWSIHSYVNRPSIQGLVDSTWQFNFHGDQIFALIQPARLWNIVPWGIYIHIKTVLLVWNGVKLCNISIKFIKCFFLLRKCSVFNTHDFIGNSEILHHFIDFMKIAPWAHIHKRAKPGFGLDDFGQYYIIQWPSQTVNTGVNTGG